MNGASLILAERHRQIAEEGYDADHDDSHKRMELLEAALCYACYGDYAPKTPPFGWPWEPEHWKPVNAIQNLIKAGALIAAEIDRLLRASENQVQ